MDYLTATTLQEYFKAVTAAASRYGPKALSWWKDSRSMQFGFASPGGRYGVGVNQVKAYYVEDKMSRRTLPGGIVVWSKVPPNDILVQRFKSDLSRALKEGQRIYERLN